MPFSTTKSINFNIIFLFLLALLFTTAFRVAFLVMYPFLVILIAYFYNLKLTKSFLNAFAVFIVSWLISLYGGFYFKYNLVSFYYFIPFLFLFLAKPSETIIRSNLIRPFLFFITFFTFVNDLFGIFQYINNPGDDNFIGIYGRFTVTQNGLSILNTILFFYYLQVYFSSKRVKYFIASVFFMCCMVLAFYGAGLLVFFMAITLFYVQITLKKLGRLVILTIVLLLLVYLLMSKISPRTLEYNIAILNKFWNASIETAPRKLLIFYNYIISYPKHIGDFIFGSGPGTFNSRTAFMVGSPTYFNFDLIKSDVQPYYFKNFAYPLWNATNTGPYDGFMNQPFSSMLALLGEFGLLLSVFLAFSIRRQYVSTIRSDVNNDNNLKEHSLYGKLYKFLLIFTVLLLVIDNFLEYPEIIALLLIILQFTRHEIQALKSTSIQKGY